MGGGGIWDCESFYAILLEMLTTLAKVWGLPYRPVLFCSSILGRFLHSSSLLSDLCCIFWLVLAFVFLPMLPPVVVFYPLCLLVVVKGAMGDFGVSFGMFFALSCVCTQVEEECFFWCRGEDGFAI